MNITDKISGLDGEQRKKLIGRIRSSGQEYGIFPLTASQEIFWRKYRLNQPLLVIGNVRFIVRFTPFTEKKARWIISELRRFHDVCRYRFIEIDGEVFQYIDNDTQPDIAVYDVGIGNTEALYGCFTDFFEKDFDLDNDFPIVFGIVKSKDDCCRIMIKMHHIAADGFSMGVVIRDIYHILSGTAVKSKVQYQDFISSIGNKVAEDTAYWTEKVRTAEKRLDPPLDHGRYTKESADNEKVCIEHISGNEFMALRDLLKNMKQNFFNVASSVLSMILQRWSFKDNMIMASTFFNRNDEDSANIIGGFSSFLPLVYHYHGDITLKEYIDENTNEFKMGMAHGNIVNLSLQEAYPYECCTGYMPMYQVIFAYHSKNIYSSVSGSAGGVSIELDDYNFNSMLERMCADLIIRIEEFDDMYLIALGYNSALFDEHSMKQLAGIFRYMLVDLSKLTEMRLDDMIIADYSDIPFPESVSSVAPVAYEEADIEISRDHIIKDSEGTAMCILDGRMQPVPMYFCGNIYVQKDGRWYSTGKSGKITLESKLSIDDDRSDLRCINGIDTDLRQAGEKLKKAFPGICIRFEVSDDGILILTYCGIEEEITIASVSAITGIAPMYVHRSKRIYQSSFRKFIRRIAGSVKILSENGYSCTVSQHDSRDAVTINFTGSSKPSDRFIESIRLDFHDDRIEYCFCNSTEKYVYPMPELTDTQKRICAAWVEIIGNDDFGIYDDFYETGNGKVGDLVLKLRKMTSKDLDIMTLFDYPNIARMSEYIDDRTS